MGIFWFILTLSLVTAYEVVVNFFRDGYQISNCRIGHTYAIVAADDDYFYVIYECNYDTRGGVYKISNSQVIWERQTRSKGTHYALSVDVDRDNGIVYIETDAYKMICKYYSNGNLVWEYPFPLSSMTSSRIKILNNGDYIIAGSNSRFARFTTNGECVWTADSNSGSYISGIEKGPNETIIIVTGHIYSSCYFCDDFPCIYEKFTAEGKLLYSNHTRENCYCENIKKLAHNDYLLFGYNHKSDISRSWVYKISASEEYEWDMMFEIFTQSIVLSANQMENGDIVLAIVADVYKHWAVILDSEGNLLNRISVFTSLGYDAYDGAVNSNGIIAFAMKVDFPKPNVIIMTPCPAGTYSNPDDPQNCIPCPIGTYQPGVREICYSCPEGTYQKNTGQNSCKPCTEHCKSCTSETSCFECVEGSFLEGNPSNISKCVITCSLGYYGNSTTGLCEPCFTGCNHCVSYYFCLSCFDPLSVKYIKGDEERSICVLDCGIGYYIGIKNTVQTCMKCDFRCFTCLGPSNKECTSCNSTKTGVIKQNSFTCICTKGYATNIEKATCDKCLDPLCIDCDLDDLAKCFMCSDTVENIIYDHVNKQCICDKGYFLLDNICKPCNVFCIECSGPTNRDCLANKCKNEAYPMDTLRTTCLHMCETPLNNLYIDYKAMVCKQCVPPCQSCFYGNAESCTSCKDGFLLYGNICVDNCPPKYYRKGNSCFPCNEKCKNCVDRVNYCINGCEEPYFYKDHRCLFDCGEGYIPINGVCELCNDGCSECIYKDSKMICLRCTGKKYLHRGECVNLCPKGFYSNTENGECIACNETCSHCFGGTNKNCYTCNTSLGYVMIAKNICNFPYCMDGSYFDMVTRACTSCPKECSKCYGPHTCTECMYGYKLNYVTKTCYDPCTKIGFTRKDNSLECEEICGDGRNMGVLECDDGNTKDNDGCSSECKIEPYYECSGGTPDNPDTCIYRKAVDVKNFEYFANRTGIITFDTKLRLLDSLENVITISLSKAEESIVEWSYEPFDTRSFTFVVLYFKFNHSLAGTEVSLV